MQVSSGKGASEDEGSTRSRRRATTTYDDDTDDYTTDEDANYDGRTYDSGYRRLDIVYFTLDGCSSDTRTYDDGASHTDYTDGRCTLHAGGVPTAGRARS